MVFIMSPRKLLSYIQQHSLVSERSASLTTVSSLGQRSCCRARDQRSIWSSASFSCRAARAAGPRGVMLSEAACDEGSCTLGLAIGVALGTGVAIFPYSGAWPVIPRLHTDHAKSLLACIPMSEFTAIIHLTISLPPSNMLAGLTCDPGQPELYLMSGRGGVVDISLLLVSAGLRNEKGCCLRKVWTFRTIILEHGVLSLACCTGLRSNKSISPCSWL